MKSVSLPFLVSVESIQKSPDDFGVRKTAPGVVRWFDFDTADQLGLVGWQNNFGRLPGTSKPNSMPVIDTAIKCSGAGSLRFDIPTNTSSDPCGAWYANFSADLSVLYGENSEFYVQWRQRFNQAFLDTLFLDVTDPGRNQGGIKQLIVGTGDAPGVSPYDSTSCSDIDVVVQTYYQHRLPIMYNACGYYVGMYEHKDGDYLLQNQTPSCLYTANQAQDASVNGSCFGWVANEWLTFQIGVKIGTLNTTTRRWDNSEVKLWGGRAGKPSQLLTWWRPGIGDYFPLRAGDPAKNQCFGKVWLLPYMTNNDAAVVHALCQTWYDDLIISTAQIADPLGN